ncbi:Hypp7308 [Branchiostoma lanceolatum]|uniref:Hypp7308 protein n=1 Tax=Branchiostoma lanceolatum TaxID=7740 RepID=A0A8J9YZJ0_BRALA|nr:Hypp7308 [Branchiostoma lanceolatum]
MAPDILALKSIKGSQRNEPLRSADKVRTDHWIDGLSAALSPLLPGWQAEGRIRLCPVTSLKTSRGPECA